jgi:hypothetical protein
MYTIEQLKEKWIVNWIGSWKFNFSVFYNKFIVVAPNFLSEKSEKLIADIEALSVYHDITYYNGNTFIDKIKADYTFALWVVNLLEWTRIRNRLFVFMTIMFILNTVGNKFYNFWEKKFVTLILKNNIWVQ